MLDQTVPDAVKADPGSTGRIPRIAILATDPRSAP
jgi:hypothetical protein